MIDGGLLGTAPDGQPVSILGALAVIYFYVQRGTVGGNRFGPDPVEVDSKIG
ncbi:MAG TPA: hypothetical protein VJ928_03480 [Marivita sp.]|nr:hypothetical protein [Marivita sp.]